MIKHKINWPLLSTFVRQAKALTPNATIHEHADLDLDAYLRAVGLPVSAASRKCVIDQILAARNALGRPVQTAFIRRPSTPDSNKLGDPADTKLPPPGSAS